MGRTTRPDGPQPNGTRVAAFNASVFAAYGRTCHLCGHAGADTADHLVPVSVDPGRRWDLGNARPAHRTCNSARGDAPVPTTYRAPSW